MTRGRERILITGAHGFAGYWIVRALTEKMPDAVLYAHGGHNDLDITDEQSVSAAIAEASPTCCIHLAAISSPPKAQQDQEHTHAVNVEGVRLLAQALLKAAPKCKLIFASSAEVYGKSFLETPAPLTEMATLQPEGVYGRSKCDAERVLDGLTGSGLRHLSLRFFNFSGPRQSTDFVIPAFASQIAMAEAGQLENGTIKVGDLSARRDFLDVRDVANACVSAIANTDWKSGTKLNISSGVPRKISDILDGLVTMSRVPVKVTFDPERAAAPRIPLSVGNSAKARALLGWKPIIPFEQTLANVLDYWRRRID